MANRWWAVVLVPFLMNCATPRVVRLDTGGRAPLEYSPPTSHRSIPVDEDAFEESLARLVLELPLSLRPTQTGWLVRTSSPGATLDRVMGGALRKDYGRWCRAHEGPGDCLSLLEDGLGFGAEARLGLALALSLDPMHESIADAVEHTFSPTFFTGLVVSSVVGWVVLAAAPEPVFTKAAAVVAAVLLVYLGVEAFLQVVKACLELKRSANAATTFSQLEAAGERFGQVVGQQGARVFVLAVAAVVGRGTTRGMEWLSARLRLLPNFTEAAALGASQVGIRLEEAASVSAVTVVDAGVAITLAPTAMAMLVMGSDGIQGDPDGTVHHICTDKNTTSDANGGPWTPLFEKIFSKAGMSLKNDRANLIRIRGHVGPHPEAYHQEVYERVSRATLTCRTRASCREALTRELQEIAQELSTRGSELRRFLTND